MFDPPASPREAQPLHFELDIHLRVHLDLLIGAPQLYSTFTFCFATTKHHKRRVS